jgi:hypothetical protein
MNPAATRNKVLVLAGSYGEYLDWRKQSLRSAGCKYIESIEDIEGHIGYGVEVILYGSYRSNPLHKTLQFQKLLKESTSPFTKYIKN